MYKTFGTHNYFVYILTNINKAVLYIGVTNDLKKRLYEHRENAETDKNHFTSKYNIFYLIYWERFDHIEQAIEREKELKNWRRSKKVKLISEFNPDWDFLNNEIG